MRQNYLYAMRYTFLRSSWSLLLYLLTVCTHNASAQNTAKQVKALAQSFLDNGKLDSAFVYFGWQDSLAVIERDTSLIIDAKSFFANYYMITKDFDRAIVYADHLLELSSIVEEDELIDLLNCCASIYQKVDSAKADSIYSVAIKISGVEESKDEAILALYANYAGFLKSKGEAVEAIPFYLKAAQGDYSPMSKAFLYTNLSNIYAEMDNPKRAREMIDLAIAVAEESDLNMRNSTIAHHNAGIYRNEHKYDSAHLEVDKAISAYKGGILGLYTQALTTKANIYMATKNWKLADSVMSLAVASYDEVDVLSKVNMLHAQASIAIHFSKNEIAVNYVDEALRLLENVGSVEQELKSYKLLHIAHDALGNTAKAYSFLSRKEVLADSMYRVSQARTVAGLEAEYKRQEQAQEIEFLDQETIAQAKIVKSQRRLLLFGGIALGLISILSSLLFRLFRRVDRQKKVIAKSLSEKDLLLREIHHRVKNNLQLVSSLLTLQGRSIDNLAAQDAINEGRSRVRSMALIHQDLYNKENLTGISVKGYLEKLCSELFATYRVDKNKVTLALQIDELELDVDTLVPLGLIINELITNTLKYAFPDGREGNLSVSISEEHDKLMLQIADDGVGYDPLEVNDQSFGSTLVSALTSQLDGALNVSSDEGTTIKISFKDYKVGK